MVGIWRWLTGAGNDIEDRRVEQQMHSMTDLVGLLLSFEYWHDGVCVIRMTTIFPPILDATIFPNQHCPDIRIARL